MHPALQDVIRCLGGSLIIGEDVAALEGHPAVPAASDLAWARTGSETGLLHGPVPSALCRAEQAGPDSRPCRGQCRLLLIHGLGTGCNSRVHKRQSPSAHMLNLSLHQTGSKGRQTAFAAILPRHDYADRCPHPCRKAPQSGTRSSPAQGRPAAGAVHRASEQPQHTSSSTPGAPPARPPCLGTCCWFQDACTRQFG